MSSYAARFRRKTRKLTSSKSISGQLSTDDSLDSPTVFNNSTHSKNTQSSFPFPSNSRSPSSTTFSSSSFAQSNLSQNDPDEPDVQEAPSINTFATSDSTTTISPMESTTMSGETVTTLEDAGRRGTCSKHTLPTRHFHTHHPRHHRKRFEYFRSKSIDCPQPCTSSNFRPPSTSPLPVSTTVSHIEENTSFNSGRGKVSSSSLSSEEKSGIKINSQGGEEGIDREGERTTKINVRVREERRVGIFASESDHEKKKSSFNDTDRDHNPDDDNDRRIGRGWREEREGNSIGDKERETDNKKWIPDYEIVHEENDSSDLPLPLTSSSFPVPISCGSSTPVLPPTQKHSFMIHDSNHNKKKESRIQRRNVAGEEKEMHKYGGLRSSIGFSSPPSSQIQTLKEEEFEIRQEEDESQKVEEEDEQELERKNLDSLALAAKRHHSLIPTIIIEDEDDEEEEEEEEEGRHFPYDVSYDTPRGSGGNEIVVTSQHQIASFSTKLEDGGKKEERSGSFVPIDEDAQDERIRKQVAHDVEEGKEWRTKISLVQTNFCDPSSSASSAVLSFSPLVTTSHSQQALVIDEQVSITDTLERERRKKTSSESFPAILNTPFPSSSFPISSSSTSSSSCNRLTPSGSRQEKGETISPSSYFIYIHFR